ncbi:AraC family transcriptional regulator [Capsulimonas corticalis]|uniref:AraC family transcriptional regulator n=2 Tax=Capsulimonas corticalis TaxID=2219043 RepID=A0A402CQG4_9BACT|nr:AraC family transcriptional regulator [Capsulimonas corticalis]
MTPLGRLTLAARIQNGEGVVPAYPLRIYDQYALVFITRGEGVYRDIHQKRIPLVAGDAIFVFPSFPHSYGPNPGTHWDELYFVFDGPAFAMLHQIGLIDPSRPIAPRQPDDRWLAKFTAFAARLRPGSRDDDALQVARLHALLTEMLLALSTPTDTSHPDDWLQAAQLLLEADLSQDLDPAEVARKVGVGYELFRKRFTQSLGVSPARYRARRRIEAACEMLKFTQMTSAQIADALGYGDEFYFSKRFKAEMGQGPREFRQSKPTPALRATLCKPTPALRAPPPADGKGL